MNWFQTLLQRTQLPGDDPSLGVPLLLRLWRILLVTNVILIVEGVLDVRLEFPILPWELFAWEFARIALYAVVLASSFMPWGRRFPAAIAGCLTLYDLAALVPSGPNHGYLGFLSSFLCSMAIVVSSDSGQEKETREKAHALTDSAWSAVFAVRWLVVYVMLWSGLNKLLYETYLQGEFFAAMIHKDPRFADFFTWIVPARELQQIVDSETGPYRFTSLLPILGANAVYVSEILAGLLLLFRRTAVYGVVLTFAILVGIEVAAVELVFGGLMVNLLLIYFPAWYVRRGYGISVAINGLLLGYVLGRLSGIIPDLGIH